MLSSFHSLHRVQKAGLSTIVHKPCSFLIYLAFQDSINLEQKLSSQIFKELRSQNSSISGFSISYVMMRTDSTNKKEKLILVETTKILPKDEKNKLEKYLRVRTENDSAKVIINER